MSQPYDVIVIGAGQTGRTIAKGLKKAGQNVGIITLNDDSATHFERTVQSLARGVPATAPHPHGPDGVDTFRGTPQFESKGKVVSLGQQHLEAKQFVIATGAVPYLPGIQGLSEIPHFTPLSIFNEEKPPESAIVVGGGPIGVRTAEWLSRKGCETHLLVKQHRLLHEEEPEIAQFHMSCLQKAGVDVRVNTHLLHVRSVKKNQSVVFNQSGIQNELQAKALVMATGFMSNTHGFGFEKLGVYINENQSVVVNDQMKTSIDYIWAAGNVTGTPFHTARNAHQAQLVINNLCSPFFSQQRMEADPFPSSFPTDPPIARFGMSEKEAFRKHRDAHTTFWTFEDKGLIKIVGHRKSGEILGVHITAPHADEIILFFDLAFRGGISLFDLLDRHHYPSPSLSDHIYAAIQNWNDEA